MGNDHAKGKYYTCREIFERKCISISYNSKLPADNKVKIEGIWLYSSQS